MEDMKVKNGTTAGGRPYVAKKHTDGESVIVVHSKQGNKTYMKRNGVKTLESQYGSKKITKGPTTKVKK